MRTKADKKPTKGESRSLGFNRKNENSFFSVQAKLKVGEPDDVFEKEADQMAKAVIDRNESGNEPFFPSSFNQGHTAVQEKPLTESPSPLVQKQSMEDEEEEMLQTQPMEEEEEEIMPKADQRVNSVNSSVEQQIRSKKGNGKPIEPGIRSQMEAGFGTDFSNVKIHSDSTATRLNTKLNSMAFTTGNDIFFNRGKYQPETNSGKRLLAHELTHTIQQGASSFLPPVQRFPLPLDFEKMLFRSRVYGPITYTNPDISGSGFEASYYPLISRLNIRLRGKVRFADALTGSGGSFSSPNFFMNRSDFIGVINGLPADVQSRILPYFQWTDAEKEIHLHRFRENLQTATQLWMSPGFTFQVDETGWEDVTATPNVNISVSEGEAAHETIDFNVFGRSLSVTNPSASDHIQIEIVKQPTVADANEIIRIINEHNASTGSAVAADTGMIRGVRSYVDNDPGSWGSAPEGFNNFMSLRSNSLSNPDDVTYTNSVYFENNESTLSESAQAGLDAFFSDPMILLNNEDRDVEVHLNGYASAPGTTNYNRSLVEQRINSVSGYIFERVANSDINFDIFDYNPDTQNLSDEPAETDLAANPETHDPASFRRVDITIVRKGRGGQNTLAHELGHAFGLGDEYESDSRSPGDAATHDQLAKDAGVTGGSVIGNDDRLMSTGNRIEAAHYSTFADALNQLTSKRWKIIT